MGRRGPKPKHKEIVWSSGLAYVVGLLTTDGCLSNDGRHIIFVSKDREQLENVMRILNIHVSIGETTSSYTKKKITRIQFGDVSLYRFLLDIGLMPNKTKQLKELAIPGEYFFDFLRGHHDGDGSFYSYFDPRWQSSFMFYLTFISASPAHVYWIRESLEQLLAVRGHITVARNSVIVQLKYAKREALLILKKLYPHPDVVCLTRKRLKIENALRIVGESLSTTV